VGRGVPDELDRGAGLDGLRDGPERLSMFHTFLGTPALVATRRHFRRYSLELHGRPVTSLMMIGPLSRQQAAVDRHLLGGLVHMHQRLGADQYLQLLEHHGR
jgi:hypothetical protein